MALRVGMDVSGAAAPATGIGRYTSALFRSLAALDALDLVPFANLRGPVPSLDPHREIHNPRWPTRAIHTAWSLLNWPPIERFTGPLDVFHTSDWSHPPLKAAARVTTVHDLGSQLHPEWYASDVQAHHAGQNEETCRLSDHVIAISEYTRDTFVERYNFPPSRISVVSNGVDPLFAPAPASVVTATRERYGLPEPYLLYVGTREKRKNVVGLIDVFARFAEHEPELRLALVGSRPWAEARSVHGSDAWSGREVEDRVGSLGLEGRVAVLGSVPLADLIALYSGAEAFVFPTLFEGFGLPVLEAMACGCPVVASSTTAVPEVVGDAGLLAPPSDPDAFAAHVQTLLTDPSLRSELISRGQVRASRFTWGRCAEGTFEAYRAAQAGE